MRKKCKKLTRKVLSLLLAGSMVLPSVYVGKGAEAKSNDKAVVDAVTKAEKGKEKKYRQYLKKSKKASQSSSNEQTMIKNDFLEFMVDSLGRFTIGNVEGNPDYTSDNGQILLFGHDDPGTSFSTIRLRSTRNEIKDFIFEADSNEYNTENKIVTSVMNAEGTFDSGEEYRFTITQYLEFAAGSKKADDTIKISYKIVNNGSAVQSAGVRIMMDTMLANNDDAPFKVVGHGNVTSELELAGGAVPATYQVYDNLENPTTFATGMLHLENERIPDKVQFARWNLIKDTLYDYKIGNREFGDSAVAVYFNPTEIQPSGSMNVCTYYGVNSNLVSEGNTPAVDSIDVSQYGVLVYDSLIQECISGAAVTIGSVTAVTNENGLAVFDDFNGNNGKSVTVSVAKDGYKVTEVPRTVLCGSFTGIGIVSENSTTQEPSVLSAVMQSGSEVSDLLTTYVYYDEAQPTDQADDAIIIRVANAGTANTYRLVQAGSVKYESKDGTFTIPLVTKDKDGNAYAKPRLVGLSAGKDVKLEMVNDGFGVKSADLGIRISKPTFSTPDKQKTSISVGDKLEFKISDDVPVLGGLSMDFGIANPLPITIKAEEGGKFRVALGTDLNDTSDKDEDVWEKYEKSYNDMIKDVKDSNLGERIKPSDRNCFGGKYGAGPLKFECQLMGYGEGIADANGNLNLELGILVLVNEEKSFTNYFFISGVPLYVSIGEKGEIHTQIKGNLLYGGNNFSFVGGDCTIQPSFQLSMEGGVGVKGAVSTSIEGSAKVNWEHRFANNYNRVWLETAATFKVQMLMFEAKKEWYEKEKVLWDSNDRRTQRRQKEYQRNMYDDIHLELSKRKLQSKTASQSNLALESMYTDVQEVTSGGKRYRFYIANVAERAAMNRTAIVYQKYENGQWTNPVLLDDDKTGDFNFSIALEGDDIYIAWENLNKVFDEGVTLTEMIQSSRISVAKLDADTDTVTKIYDAADDQKGDFLPAITITSGKAVKIVWYSNANNYLCGNTVDVQEGKDTIYSVELSSDKQAVGVPKTEQHEIETGHIISVSAGILDDKDTIAYALDADGDFSSEADIALCVLKDNQVEQIPSEKINTNAKYIDFDGKKTMFYYSSGNIAYTTSTKEEDIKYVFAEDNLPSGINDKFTILTDENHSEYRILWKGSNQDGGQDIYAVSYRNNKWSEPYILKTIGGSEVSIPTGYIDSEGTEITYGYNKESESCVVSEKIKDRTDLSLNGVFFEQEDVQPGSDLDFKIQVSNIGTKDISSVHVEVFQDDISIKQQEVSLNLGAGVTNTYDVSSAFDIPDDMDNVRQYKVVVYADGESDLEDNEKNISVGYTDIAIENNGQYLVNGNQYIALNVNNESKFDAKGVRLRLLADSMDGAVIYDNYIGDVKADSSTVYNINIGQLSNSRMAYAVVSCESQEAHQYNNTELLAVNTYLSNTPALYNFTIMAEKGGRILQGMENTYAAGTEIAIKAEADTGYAFAGWVAESGTFKNASQKETTFVMPEQNVTVTAKFNRIQDNNSGGSIVQPTSVPSQTPTPVPSQTPEADPTVAPGVTPVPSVVPEPSVQPGSTPKTDNEKKTSKSLKKNSVVSDSKTKSVYKVTGTGKNKTVEYVRSTKKNASRVTVPAKVKLKGHNYKVTSIAKNALKNSKKLSYLTIGKNVKKIGKKAFYGCKKLRYIYVKSKKLTAKNIGKQAFGGGYRSPKVQSDKKVWKKYARILPAKGLSKRAVFIIKPENGGITGKH